jgi:tRNA-modifying protein YgfZ
VDTTDPLDTGFPDDEFVADAFVDPAARDRVIVTGADAASYLQSQIAQDIGPLQVGSSMWTLVLEPTGKVDTFARITRRADDEFVFDTDAGFGDGLAARLRRFKIRVAAEIVVELAGSGVPSADVENARIAAGWPRMGHEIVPGDTIPAVTGVTGLAVSFTKGCYPGQELVERMDSRGSHAPLSLRVLTLGDQVPADVAVGDAVVDADGTPIGTVTSVGSTHALATIKRAHSVGTLPPHTLRTL